MKKSWFLLCMLSISVMWSPVSAYAADTAYVAVKAGVFFPNGKNENADKTENGFSNFDSGYNVELAVGFKPESYVAVELGTGMYSTEGKVNDLIRNSSYTAYGVPVTVTAKGILDLEKWELFAGGGIGYYFGFIDNKTNFVAGPVVDESSHGGAIGYHAVAGADYIIDKKVSVGAEFKWFSARPELELTNSGNVKAKSKWEIGGSVLNLGVKYIF